MNLDKNEQQPEPSEDSRLLDLRVDKLVTGGAGLARHEGEAVFVPLTAPGDLAHCRIVERHKGFARAELVEIRESGPDRVEPPCPHFGECGGCDLQHLTPDAQRTAKAAIVADCFQRLGKVDVSGIISGPEPGDEFGYRNRIRLQAHPTGRYGLRRRGSHDVVPIDACPLVLAQFDEQLLPWLRMLPPVDQIVVRLDGQGGWLLSLFGQPARLKILKRMLASAPADEPPAPGCVGLLFNNRPVWGRDYLIQEVDGHKFRVGAQGFFQGNHAVTETVVALVRTWLGELSDAGRLGNLLADLYCGAGLFTLTLADLFERIIAVEMDPGGFRDARNNVQRDTVARDRAAVHQGDLAQVLGRPELADAATWQDAVCLVDPPRSGLGKSGLKALCDKRPRHIVYMSCDPATLARDTGALTTAGYALRKLQVLDMFPQTAHVECLLLLERKDSGAD